MDLMYVSLTLFLLFIVSFSFHLLFYHHHHHQSRKNLPPGSAGWPIIGESLDFLSAGWKGHPEKFILDRISKYSSSIFRTHLLGSQAVVFCGPARNKFLFSNEYKLVQAWWPSSVDKIFPYSAQTSSKEAIRFRKMLPNFLKPEALHRYIGIMDAVAHHHFTSDWENKDFVIVFPLTKRYTFRLACRLFLSLEDINQVTEFTESFNNLAGGIMSVPINFPGTPFHRAIKASSSIRKKLLQIIKERKRDLGEGKAEVKHDILSHMLLTSEPETGKFMGEADIADKILGLLIGGHDTTSSACTSIVKYLAELPEVYRRVFEEQTEIEKSKAPGELLNWEDIQKMKYSWNVACEVLRLAPPVQGSFREALTDFMYNGFFIPKGWKIYWSATLTHKDSELFPEPEKFDPSRFEESGPAPYTFVPFGGGPRTCPGKEYARIEMLVFMHHLVKRFKWEKAIPNEKIVVDPMPVPEKGLPIRLFPHHRT